jgi:inhibitor of cysteine peptidase
MKIKFIFASLFLILFVLPVNTFAKEAKNVSHDEIIQARVGEEVVITLESNRTTGFQWQLASPVDKDYLVISGLKYVVPKSKLLGGPGKEEWSFKVLKAGSTTVCFHYVRPWEKKSKPAKVRTIVIIIK